MNNGIMLAAVIGPVYLVLGLSMFLQNDAWVRRVKALIHDEGERVMFSLIELVGGLIIVLKHNEWELTPWLIVTLTGWAMIAEALVGLLIPEKSLRKIMKGWNHASYYKMGGVVMIVLGLWLCYSVYLGN